MGISQIVMGKTKKRSLFGASDPTEVMQQRAVEAIEAAHRNSQLLLAALQALRQQSDPAMLVGLREDVAAAARNFVDALEDPELRDRFGEFRLPESEFSVEHGLAIQNG